MNRFVEICQETTYCMRYPQQDSTGWFLWAVWGCITLLLLVSLLGSRTALWTLVTALKKPFQYNGRIGRDEFSTVYFSLQTLRCLVIISVVLLVAMYNHIHWVVIFILVPEMALLVWLSTTLYCNIIRRGHDFNFSGKESLLAYGLHFLHRFEEENHTWHIICNQKGNPYPNRFGVPPQENDYLIPPQDTQLLDVWEEYRKTPRK